MERPRDSDVRSTSSGGRCADVSISSERHGSRHPGFIDAARGRSTQRRGAYLLVRFVRGSGALSRGIRHDRITDPAEIERLVREHGRWWHEIELAPGIVTPGDDKARTSDWTRDFRSRRSTRPSPIFSTRRGRFRPSPAENSPVLRGTAIHAGPGGGSGSEDRGAAGILSFSSPHLRLRGAAPGSDDSSFVRSDDRQHQTTGDPADAAIGSDGGVSASRRRRRRGMPTHRSSTTPPAATETRASCASDHPSPAYSRS